MVEDLWKLKLSAFLHDPPDKALKIAKHEKRREDLLRLIGIEYDEIADVADHVSSAMQRLNITEDCKVYIDFSHQKKPIFKHPLSAVEEKKYIKEITDYIINEGYDQCFDHYKFNTEDLKSLIDIKNESFKKTYLSTWRLLPEKYPIGNFLPADTRIPDHSIYDHMDVTSALAPCIKNEISFLSFKIGPVQEFIENARKTADLWQGSHLLSYLSFSAIRTVAEEYGPDAVVFPYLRGQPFVDVWLHDDCKVNIQKPSEKRLRISNIPHRFLAIIPSNRADELSTKIQKSVKEAWLKITNDVLEVLKLKCNKIASDNELKKNWDRQIGEAFTITTHLLKWANPPEDNNAVCKWFNEIHDVLPEDILSKYNDWLAHYTKPNTGPLYGLYYELISAFIDQKSRFFKYTEEPDETGRGDGGGRCSLCGIRNPIRITEQEPKQFWKEVQEKFPEMFKDGERLCAVCTIKRFYNTKEINPFKIEWGADSVATIAMREFLDKCKSMSEYDNFRDKFNEIIGSRIRSQKMCKDNPEGEWFYLESYDSESIKREYGVEITQNKLDELKEKLKCFYTKNGQPPKYYAILVMDGDEIGKKLRGEKGLPLKNFLHPLVVDNLNKSSYTQILESPRILNPNIHIAISRALLEFSVNFVGSIIERHKGLLVYSGGDDVLALLPAEKALDAAKEINGTFEKDFDTVDGDKTVMLLGKGSTMSAGIVFVHYKYPLYEALEKARDACKRAKNEYGRNSFVLVDIRHSGQISTAGGKWKIVDNLKEFVHLMLKEKEESGISSRFIYRLLQDIDVIEKLDIEGKKAYLKYLLNIHVGEKIEKRSEKILKFSMVFLDDTNTLPIVHSMEEIAKNIRILYTVYKEDKEWE